jgi:hypothetical protein
MTVTELGRIDRSIEIKAPPERVLARAHHSRGGVDVVSGED